MNFPRAKRYNVIRSNSQALSELRPKGINNWHMKVCSIVNHGDNTLRNAKSADDVLFGEITHANNRVRLANRLSNQIFPQKPPTDWVDIRQRVYLYVVHRENTRHFRQQRH